MAALNRVMKDANKASQWLKKGRLLVYPTEGVWGIGCDAFNENAVKKILHIKRRPIEKGMIVITDDANRILPLLDKLSTTQQQKILKSWQNNTSLASQQAITWLIPLPIKQVYDQNICVPSWITGRHDSVAIRVIKHPLIKVLCQNMVSEYNPYGFIVSTSCNPSCEPPARSIDEAYMYFSQSDCVAFLEGDTLGYSSSSQIIDIITGNIIR